MVALDLRLKDAGLEPPAKAQIDIRGSFSFDSLPQEGKYTLDVASTGYGSITIKTSFAKPGEHIDLPPIVLTPANLEVAGTAVDADGKPAPGVMIGATGQPHMIFRNAVRGSRGHLEYDHGAMPPFKDAVTDARGHFVFDEVAMGPIMIWGNILTNNDDGYAGNPIITAQGGDTNIVLRLVVPATHSAMEAWQAGDKRAAIDRFIKVDWSVRPLFASYRALSMTEEQFVALSGAEREARSKEVIKEVASFKKLVATVFEAGHEAAAKRDDAQARKIFTSLKLCGAALDNPDCLRLLQIVGKHLKEKADSALVLAKPKLGRKQLMPE